MTKLETLESCQCCGSSAYINLKLAAIDEELKKLFELQEDFGWSLCTSCSFIFQNPRLPKAVQEIFYEGSGYRKTGPDIISEGYKSFAPQQLARFDRWLLMNGYDLRTVANGCCLDYGCGIGGALGFLTAGNNQCYGIELDKALADYGNAHYGVKIVPRIEDLPAGIMFDLIFTHNAVEHAYDPNEFFRYASDHLKPTGKIVFLVPAWRSSNTMETLLQFGLFHNSMWDHVALARFANKHGLFLSGFSYGNPAPDGDWEICGVLEKSPKKNHFSFSVEEIINELYYNIKLRAETRAKREPIRSEIMCCVG